MIRVTGPREPRNAYPGVLVVNTTSRATDDWQRGLSPFHLGPVRMYPGAGVYEATNVENAWQFAKVYARHVGDDGKPTPDYFEWARAGWRHRRAIRYPMGKGAVPEFSWWDGEPLTYVEARKKVYTRIYAKAVYGTPAFEQLAQLYRDAGEILLWDFDGYDHHKLGMSLKEVLHDPTRKMGHAFVLAMLLEGAAKEQNDEPREDPRSEDSPPR
jgi:hypothetical protein